MVYCTDNSYSLHLNNLLLCVVLISSLEKTNPLVFAVKAQKVQPTGRCFNNTGAAPFFFLNVKPYCFHQHRFQLVSALVKQWPVFSTFCLNAITFLCISTRYCLHYCPSIKPTNHKFCCYQGDARQAFSCFLLLHSQITNRKCT